MGFIAGTLVHTDKGLVPVEQIRIGDMVLASPELSTGIAREYKRVVNTFRAESEEIWQLGVGCSKVIDGELCMVHEFIYLTKFHPVYLVYSEFYEHKSGHWIPAHEFCPGDRILLAAPESDNDRYETIIIKPIEKFDDTVGYCADRDAFFDCHSFVKITEDGNYETLGHWKGQPSSDELIKGNYREFDYCRPEDKDLENRFLNRKPLCPNLEAPVFNLEVEDFHTYFVGELGLWVHNNNACAGMKYNFMKL